MRFGSVFGRFGRFRVQFLEANLRFGRFKVRFLGTYLRFRRFKVRFEGSANLSEPFSHKILSNFGLSLGRIFSKLIGGKILLKRGTYFSAIIPYQILSTLFKND